MAFDPRLRSSKEEPLFIIGMIFSILVWLGVALSIIGLFYGLAIMLFVLMAHALFLSHVKGNGVHVNEQQLPEVYALCKESAQQLGLERVPEIYVMQSGGMLNAFATKFLSRNFVILLSDLVDNTSDPRQLKFIIGHEMAHVAAGHLKFNAVLAPFRLLPWLGPAYSRACEYTCDRAGMHVVGDLEQASRGLTILAAGGKLATRVNLSAFAAQREQSGHFWMAVLELCSSHPFLCKRVAALQELAAPGTVKKVGRNWAAYPLAPFLGFAQAGGSAAALVIVAWIGVMAAIAVPNFIKFQERARQAQAQAAIRQQEREELEALRRMSEGGEGFEGDSEGRPSAGPDGLVTDDAATTHE